MMQDNIDSQDVASIREWLAKEDCLPQDFDDFVIKKFLHSCYGSLERTKQCLMRFCSARFSMVEVYNDRDPCSSRLKTAFSLSYVATYRAKENEYVIYQLNTPTYDNFVYYDVVSAFTIEMDHWLKCMDMYPEGHYIVFDFKHINLKIIPKVNIMFHRELLLFMLEGMPIRVKGVHCINAPSYFDTLYNLVKHIIPQNIRDIVYVHTSIETLHQYLDKKYLPIECGGEAESVKVQHERLVKEVQTPRWREWFLNDNKWKADPKKMRQGGTENAMIGSFRTLSID